MQDQITGRGIVEHEVPVQAPPRPTTAPADATSSGGCLEDADVVIDWGSDLSEEETLQTDAEDGSGSEADDNGAWSGCVDELKRCEDSATKLSKDNTAKLSEDKITKLSEDSVAKLSEDCILNAAKESGDTDEQTDCQEGPAADKLSLLVSQNWERFEDRALSTSQAPLADLFQDFPEIDISFLSDNWFRPSTNVSAPGTQGQAANSGDAARKHAEASEMQPSPGGRPAGTGLKYIHPNARARVSGTDPFAKPSVVFDPDAPVAAAPKAPGRGPHTNRWGRPPSRPKDRGQGWRSEPGTVQKDEGKPGMSQRQQADFKTVPPTPQATVQRDEGKPGLSQTRKAELKTGTVTPQVTVQRSAVGVPRVPLSIPRPRTSWESYPGVECILPRQTNGNTPWPTAAGRVGAGPLQHPCTAVKQQLGTAVQPSLGAPAPGGALYMPPAPPPPIPPYPGQVGHLPRFPEYGFPPSMSTNAPMAPSSYPGLGHTRDIFFHSNVSENRRPH